MNQKTGTIKDIVRRGQDMLRRLEYSKMCQWERENFEHRPGLPWYHLSNPETGKTFWSTTPGWATPESKVAGICPQSLGELCIEIAQGKITEPHTEYSEGDGWITTITYRYPINKWVRGDIQQLKQAMWHRGRP